MGIKSFFFLLAVAATIANAQIPELEAQKKSLPTLPAISYQELEQCVVVGGNPATATKRFLSAGTGKTSLFSSATTYKWEPGLFQERSFALAGMKWKSEVNPKGLKTISYFDGSKYYDSLDVPGQLQVYVRDGMDPFPSLVQRAFVPLKAAYKVVGRSTSLEFGHLVHLSSGMIDMDIATDRDFMIVHTRHAGFEDWVLKAQKIEGHWIPIYSLRRWRREPMDVFTSILNIQRLPKEGQLFNPQLKPGNLFIEKNTAYRVDKKGVLVKVQVPPDPVTQYKAWAKMASAITIILAAIFFVFRRLTRKPEAMPN